MALSPAPNGAFGHDKLETTAIYAEFTIRQLIEVHARCQPSAQLPTLENTAESS